VSWQVYIPRLKQASIMRKVVFLNILLCFALSLQSQTFRDMQLRYERVREASHSSDQVLRSKFEAAGVSYPPKYIYWRAFKTEKQLELWASDDPYKPHKLIYTYNICRLSGMLGFKAKEGDMQIPEGIYYINRFNPWSNYYLSFRLSYPNGVDSFWGYRPKLGGQIFIHGECATIGCLPMTDSMIGEIYWASVQAKSYQGFISQVPIHVFPFRPENRDLATMHVEWAGDYIKNEKRWNNLFFAYHHFERARFPARGYHDKKGFYHFDTIPPRVPRKIIPIHWSPIVNFRSKSDTPYEMMRSKRLLRPFLPASRAYVVDITRKELSSKTNYRLSSKYVEIKPDSGVWRPYNAPKRYRKVIDTVYLNQSP